MEMEEAVPQQNDHSFADWWAKLIRRVKKEYKKWVNSLIIRTTWLIWKHRNSCVFDGATPSVNEVLGQFRDEYPIMVLGWSYEAPSTSVRWGRDLCLGARWLVVRCIIGDYVVSVPTFSCMVPA